MTKYEINSLKMIINDGEPLLFDEFLTTAKH
jgi:hypothetical protein